MCRLTVDTRERAQEDMTSRVSGAGRASWAGAATAKLLPLVVVDAVCTRGRESSQDELPFHTRVSPGLGSQLDDASHAIQQRVQLPGVGEVLDVVHDFFHDHRGHNIDGLLGVGGRVRRLERLLTPEGLATDRFAPNIHRQDLEERVCLVVPTTQSEKERLEDAVGERLGNHVLNVRGPQLARSWSVVEEGWHFRRNLLEDVLWRIDRQVGEMLSRQLGDQAGELTKSIQARRDELEIYSFSVAGFMQTAKKPKETNNQKKTAKGTTVQCITRGA